MSRASICYLLIALAAILGYVYGVKDVYTFTTGSGMALVTTIGLLVLGSGILVAVCDRGVAALLIDEGAAGVLTRRLLPAALLAPIVLGVIRVAGETAGIYDSDVGVDGITGPVTELQRQQLGRINASARHLLGLIDEILTFARVDIGRERVRWESMSINHTLGDAAALVEPMAAAKDIKFVVDLLDEDQAIQTDGTKFRQMLVNLLSNGIKFTDKGEVRVSCVVSKAVLEVRIADTGVGISADNIENVFEPFWQAEQTATRRTGGTGLGLSVTRKLARLLGGDVTVASRQGAGTTFLLTLPIEASAGETVRRRDTPTTPQSAIPALHI